MPASPSLPAQACPAAQPSAHGRGPNGTRGLGAGAWTPGSGLAVIPRVSVSAQPLVYPPDGPFSRERNLTRHFKPISRRASGEPRKLLTIRSVVNKYDKIANYGREASVSCGPDWLWPRAQGLEPLGDGPVDGESRGQMKALLGPAPGAAPAGVGMGGRGQAPCQPGAGDRCCPAQLWLLPMATPPRPGISEVAPLGRASQVGALALESCSPGQPYCPSASKPGPHSMLPVPEGAQQPRDRQGPPGGQDRHSTRS